MSRMDPGPLLDAKVAEEVMGAEWVEGTLAKGWELLIPGAGDDPLAKRRPDVDGSLGVFGNCPRYSTALGPAFEVAHQLRSEGWMLVVKHMPDGHPFVAQGSGSELAPSPDEPIPGSEGKAFARFVYMRQETPDDSKLRLGCIGEEMGETVPHAICLAALRARELERKHQDTPD